MYYIVVYDVGEKRVAKVLSTLRRYLHWVQNSVHEGELTEKKFEEMQTNVADLLVLEEDHIIIYGLTQKWLRRSEIGCSKNTTDTFL